MMNVASLFGLCPPLLMSHLIQQGLFPDSYYSVHINRKLNDLFYYICFGSGSWEGGQDAIFVQEPILQSPFSCSYAPKSHKHHGGCTMEDEVISACGHECARPVDLELAQEME